MYWNCSALCCAERGQIFSDCLQILNLGRVAPPLRPKKIFFQKSFFFLEKNIFENRGTKYFFRQKKWKCWENFDFENFPSRNIFLKSRIFKKKMKIIFLIFLIFSIEKLIFSELRKICMAMQKFTLFPVLGAREWFEQRRKSYSAKVGYNVYVWISRVPLLRLRKVSDIIVRS